MITISLPGKTQTQQPVVPGPVIPITGETAGTIGGLSFVVGLVVLWLRRRVSRDGLEITKDRAEGGMVDALLRVNKSLTEENERLMQVANDAWRVRNSDAKRIAILETELGYMRRELGQLGPMVRSSSRALESSGLMPLQELGDQDETKPETRR